MRCDTKKKRKSKWKITTHNDCFIHERDTIVVFHRVRDPLKGFIVTMLVIRQKHFHSAKTKWSLIYLVIIQTPILTHRME